MTDYEAVQKYWLELKVDPGQGLLVWLDDHLEIIKTEWFADSDILLDAALELSAEKKNFIRINRMRIDTFWFAGNTFKKTIEYKDGSTSDFSLRRKTEVKVEDVIKDLKQLSSGIVLGDEERSKYSS